MYGTYDVTQKKASGSMSVIGTFNDHRVAYAMTKHGNDRVLAGWSGVKGAHTDGWLYALSNAGFKAWEMSYGKSSDEAFNAVMPLAGGLLASGWTSYSSSGGLEVWVVRTDSAGKQQWETKFGTDGDDYALGMAPSADGALLVGAAAVTSKTIGTATMWRIDGYGNVSWQQSLNKTGRMVLNDIIALNDGALAAGFRAFGDDVGLRLLRTDVFGHGACADSGQCAGKTLAQCDDGKPCTADSCEPGNGCSHVNFKPGAHCGAGAVCDKIGVCK